MRTLLVKLLGLVTATLVLMRCTPIRSESAVSGVYELKVGYQKIVLKVEPNHSFEETIQFASGQVSDKFGRWQWAYGGLSFDGLWIPSSFAPDYILRADSEAEVGQQKYTEPGHWSITAESHWGKTVLPVFPDVGINFEMVKHLDK